MSYFEDVENGAGKDFTPPQALLASVLEVALLDFARAGDDPQVRQHRNSAQRWLFGAPMTGNGVDFDHVCDVLNLQPEKVRELALTGRTRLFPTAGVTRASERLSSSAAEDTAPAD